jgi:Protein of unknown function (DUF3800)
MRSRRTLNPYCGDIHYLFEIPHVDPPKSVLTLTTYVDESQHDETARHVVVAGFCGSEDEWGGFSEDWREGLGKRKALHMKDLRWNGKHSERRVKKLLERLGPIPHRHHLSPVCGAVKVSDYFDLVAGEKEFERKICGYFLCLSVIFAVLARDLPGHGRVNIVCEEQGQYEILGRALFESFRKMVAKDPRNVYFSGLKFIPKDSSPLIQPSDYLAFAMGKYLDERGSKKDAWCRPIFGAKNPESIPGRRYTKEKVRKTVSEILAAIRANRLSRIGVW